MARKVKRSASRSSGKIFEKHPDMQWLIPMAVLVAFLVIFFVR